jgi:diadenosine tetraphosphatase ApaH/serine/threonine PP2A family protein phosphatase
MRYLILSDIHANLEALDTCLADARARDWNEALVLGDLVGYGADPNAAVERVRDLPIAAIVRGNHDKIAIGLTHADGFNTVARIAARWTVETLTPENRAWVANLPQGPQAAHPLIEICHGTPYDEDAYLFDESDARLSLSTSTRPLCLFGHTHVPVTFELVDGTLKVAGPSAQTVSRLDLRAAAKYLVNPGSIGQPRDGDPRAAYAIVDTEKRTVETIRLAYPVEEAQQKIVAAGLPEVLARRLAAGR